MLKQSGIPKMTEKMIIVIILFITSTILFADHKITRGPDIGEIYYIGPSVTQFNAIYHSTDFGETAACMDSISEVISICADLTPGSLYRTRMPDVLYYSNNYGEYGSWVFRSNNIALMLSGRNEGFIYNKCTEHSEDYGANFIEHSCNGYYGILKSVEIDNQDDIGYVITEYPNIPDSLYMLISHDNFENFELQHTFDLNWSTNLSLSRGSENGELYLFKKTISNEEKELMFSNNYGETWELKNTFNCPNLPITSITGGRQSGELFMNVEYIQLMGDVKHTFIYHSLDYGATFTNYHTFSYGDEPTYANFEATPIEGSAPLTVQFTDLSNGTAFSSWEWDFQNDGIIDSYEQNPEFTYQDSGYYTVTLSLPPFNFYPATRYDYIHVTSGSSANENNIEFTNYELNNYPNSFNPSTKISFNLPENKTEAIIEIYNLKGQLVNELQISNSETSINWNAEGFSSGIYFYKLNFKDSPIKKMLLLK